MALVTTDLLEALFTNYKAIFVKEFAAAEGAVDYRKIVTEFPSNTLIEDYSWLGTVPAMREWVDERVPRGLLGFHFAIRNKHWESSIQVDRDTIEDDNYGLIKPRIQQLAAEAARYPDQLVFELLDAGATGLAFDGVAFFSATRTIGESANINNIAAGAYAADAAKIRAGIAAAVTQMRLFEDDRGRPMNLKADTLVCAPAMEIIIREALLPSVAGTTRPETEWVKQIVISPHLTSGATAGHDYYLFCCNQPLKPIFFQNRKSPEFTALDNPQSESVWKKRQFLYGVDSRNNVGYGDPRYAVMVDCSD